MSLVVPSTVIRIINNNKVKVLMSRQILDNRRPHGRIVICVPYLKLQVHKTQRKYIKYVKHNNFISKVRK